MFCVIVDYQLLLFGDWLFVGGCWLVMTLVFFVVG